jgi:hypothetical protein
MTLGHVARSLDVAGRVQRSSRVRRLLATAIEVAAKDADYDLSAADAWHLAEVGSVDRALAQLKVQLQVRRGAPGVQLGDAAQYSIAIAEIVADARGLELTADERIALRGQLVEGAARLEEEQHRVAAATKHVEQLLRDEAQRSGELRRFLRMAANLRLVLRNRLQAEIVDLDARANALAGLDEIFERACMRALSK